MDKLNKFANDIMTGCCISFTSAEFKVMDGKAHFVKAHVCEGAITHENHFDEIVTHKFLADRNLFLEPVDVTLEDGAYTVECK